MYAVHTIYAYKAYMLDAYIDRAYMLDDILIEYNMYTHAYIIPHAVRDAELAENVSENI
jgi:hypothetical protein